MKIGRGINMFKCLLFLWKYKILKDPVNLTYHPKEFFVLSKNTQRKVLDQYFQHLSPDFSIVAYFNSDVARYYEGAREVNFFHCYYFDKLLIERDVNAISFVDKFFIAEEKVNYLIAYCLDLCLNQGKRLDITRLLVYPDDLPKRLSQNVDFMSYLIQLDYSYIKYLVFSEEHIVRQRELIQLALVRARDGQFNFSVFLKSDGQLPVILQKNYDFVLYLIENDVCYTSYLTNEMMEQMTISAKNILVQTIITSLKKKPEYLSEIEKNLSLASYLNEDIQFIGYLIREDVHYIRYICFHHLTHEVRQKIIDEITFLLEDSQQEFNIMDYSFRSLFFENYSFMRYLLERDFRWIAVSAVNQKEENDKLILLYFKKMSLANYHFQLKDFLVDGEYLNHRLIENKKMFGYLIQNVKDIVQYIDFFHLTHVRNVVENLLFYIEKKDYEFCNDYFLVNGKYPIALSNSYRFMRYVIDKNFNNLAYIDLSMIPVKEKTRIINYAFRMVYYIRGNNRRLNFDLDGYFRNSEVLQDPYFQECLNSL